MSRRRSLWLVFVLAAQHVIVLFSGIILVPVMLVNIYDFSEGAAHYLIFSTALCAAAATLFQLVRGKWFGLGLPMFMGTSGAFLTCAHSAIELGGPALLAGMVLVSAPFQILFSYLIRFMRHILTPTVGGVIIMLAVVGLLKDSVATWTDSGHLTGWLAYTDIATGTATLLVMLAVEWFGGRRLRPWGLALGIFAGCLLAWLAGLPVIPRLADLAWFGFPAGNWPGFAFSFTTPDHWTLAFTFILAVLASSVKYAGDVMVLQKVTEPARRKINYDALQGGLYANSLGMLLAGLAGGMPSSSHSSNIPLMSMTGVATRRVAAVASLLLAAVSMSPKMLQLLVSVPQPVVGGVGVVLVAHLFSSGMQLVAEDMNHRNGLIAGLSLCAGLIAVSGNFFPGAFPHCLDPLMQNGVALGGLVAVVLTLVTRFSTDRGIRITVGSQMSRLPEFKANLLRAANRLRLDGAQIGYLELACEEVFVYMHDEYKSLAYDGPISFLLRRNRTGTMVEASGGTRFSSEADEMAGREMLNLETLGNDELSALGLLLLGRIARDVTHVTIAGYTYIQFTIATEQ